MSTAARPLAAALLCLSTLSAGEWKRITSPHFEMFTTAGERRGRDALLHFERVRGFFLQAMGIKDLPGVVRIVGFDSEKEYAPYRMNEFATAFYQRTRDRDYIVMSNLSMEHYPVVAHEYAHYLLRTSKQEFPPWFNEGFAEVFSRLRPIGNKVQVGEPLLGRMQVLATEKWLDLPTLLTVGHDSPHYNEKRRAGVFYAESWALVHMLFLDEQYRPKFNDMLRAVTTGMPPVELFQKVYARDLPQVDRDLNAYVRKSSFRVALFPVQLAKASETPEVETADMGVVGGALIDILAGTRKTDAALAMCKKMAQEHPKTWQVQVAWGHAVERTDMAAAMEHYARAAALNAADAKFYYDYSRLLAWRNQYEDAEKMAAKSLELEAVNNTARIHLARLLMHRGRYADARTTLLAIKKADAEGALQLFYAYAYSSYRLKDVAEARQALTRARPFAKTEGERHMLDQLAQALDRPAPKAVEIAEAPVQRAAEVDEEDDPAVQRPKMRRIDKADIPREFTAPPPPPDPELTGTLTNIECKGASAVLHVEAAGAQHQFVIRDPQSVIIEGANGASVDFTCGPQKPPRPLRVSYKKDADGIAVVRTIEFR